MDMINQFKDWLGEGNYWVVQVFLVVTATLAAALVVKLVLDRLAARAELSHNLWDDALLEALRTPLHWAVWLLGLSLAAELTGGVADSELFQLVEPARRAGIILLLTWLLLRFIRGVEKNLMDPEYSTKPMDETTVLAIGKLLRMSVVITAVLVLLQSMGYSISGVLAFGGIGGIAVGFAAKDLLANFFGGMMVYLDRPFSVGDWVRSPDQEIEGTVEDIGWRITRIRTFDQRPLYVPNATFTHVSLENPSRMYNRRIYEKVGIRYDDAGAMAEIIKRVKEYLQQHKEIDTNRTLIVNFNTFAPSSLEFFVYAFTKTVQWVEYHEIKQEILLGILAIIEDCGAQCALPTSTVHIPDGLQMRPGDLPDGAAPTEARENRPEGERGTD